MNWKLLAKITGVAFLFLAACLGARYQGLEQGNKEGLEAYHKMCFEVGGYVFSEDDGSIVACKGQGFLSIEERGKLNASIVHQ